MYRDDAVEEIRKRRRTLFREKYHGSVREMVLAEIEYQRKHPEQFTKPEPLVAGGIPDYPAPGPSEVLAVREPSPRGRRHPRIRSKPRSRV
jgi:hypothetical protein